MTATLLALHGVPTSPALWSRLPLVMEAPALAGTLAAQVEAVVPRVGPDTVLVGHDMGGVVAALVALRTRPRAVILSGTALGPYWTMVRATAWPLLWRYFYARHAGRRFVAGAVTAEHRAATLQAFPGADPMEMRAVAQAMRVPPDLAGALAKVAPVALVWGDADRWYPPWLARRIAARTGAEIHWVRGGHFAMWENPAGYDKALRTALSGLGITNR